MPNSKSSDRIWVAHEGVGPLFATAIHAGHTVRRELLPLLALDESTRLREEDPYTDRWVKVMPSWIVAKRSRFEVDLNRQREEAVYLTPEVAWGLHVWKIPLSNEIVNRSLQEYDDFYHELSVLLDHLKKLYRHFVIFDLHSYNYRRKGHNSPPSDPETNPEVNVGTGSLDRDRFERIVDRFIQDLSAFDFLGRHLDVRENVKFKGRQLAGWIHSRYPEAACVLSVEFKKFFMDEWSGEGDDNQITTIRSALNSTIPGIMEELKYLEEGNDKQHQ
jgi:hypothetical protein